MGAGVDGAVILAAVELVVEELDTGTGRVILHLHSMEGTPATGHHTNQLPAIRTVVQVKTKIRFEIAEIY